MYNAQSQAAEDLMALINASFNPDSTVKVESEEEDKFETEKSINKQAKLKAILAKA